MDSNKHHPFISSYVHKGTGRITTNPFGFHQAKSLVDEAAEDIFQELGATGIHCYRDVHTGEVSSETARVHRHGGGFAVAKRQRMLPGQEEDGRSVFAHTEMKTIHHGLKHIFRCNGDQNHAASAIHQGTAPDEEMQIDQAMAPEEENQAFDPTPTIARSGRRIYTRRMRRKKEKELKLSDSDKLAESINIQTQNIVRLSRESAHNPHIRVYHTYRKGRTFAYATAFLKSERGPQAIISVLWETRTNPRRGVTTTFSISSSSESLTAHCSCDYLITQTKGSSPNCYHAQTLFNNQDFVDRITREITRRQQHPEARYERCVFGDEIDLGQVRDSSPFLTAVLRREESMQRNVKKPWLFFMVLDIRLQLFVPVVKNAQKSLECQGCRLSSVMGSNCCHVVACIAACKKLRNSGGWYRFLDRLGLIDNISSSERDTDIEDEGYWSEEEPESNRGANKSVSVPEVYYPTGFKRPILPCPGELRMMRKLAEMIDHLPEGETLTFDEKDIVSCPDCKRKNTRELYPGYRREVTLFTLTQGAPTIHIYDWFCHACEKKRNFSGKNCAVFPAFRNSCYTTELLYVILEMTCLHALSFRTAYRITRLIARSPSVARKLGRWAQQDLLDQSKRSRRRMNDAFGAFVERLDTSSIHVTEKLFSCSNCEVPLSADDCNELGIEPSRSNDLKRLRAVVIDGTAAGILTKLPDYDRNTTIVRGAEGGFATFHLIKPKLHNNAVKKLFDVMKASLRQWSSARSEASTSQLRDFDSDVLKFWVQNPTKANIRGVVCSKRLLGEKESQFAQLFIDENACFCQGESARRALTNEHWDECEVIRQKFRDPLDNLIARRRVENIRDLLKQLFTVTQYVVPDPGNELEEMVTEENPPGYRDRENETSEEEDGIEEEEEPIRILHGTVSGAWFALNLPIENTSPLFIDSLIALLRFLLLEHISLPYSGRLSNRTESLHAANTQNEEAPLDPVAGTSVEDGIQMNSGAQVEGLEASFNTEEDLPPMVSFAKHAFQLHEELFARLAQYTDCMHFRENGRVHNLPPECECVKEVKTAIVALNDANPILGTFCQELLKLTRPLGVSHSSFVASLITTSRLHIDEARHFFIALANNLPDECRDYWDEYSKTMRLSNNASLQSLGVNHEIVDEKDRNTSHDGGELTSSIAPGVTASNNRHPTGNREATDPTSHEDPNGTNLDDNTSQDRDEYDVAEKELIASKLAGICFPGRLSCRPSIIFKGRDRSDCSKHYKTSRSHTPGLLTVQCSCDSPKLLGFIIMTQAESTALALSSVLTHFSIPPRTVFYDNACNLYKSVLIRVPWLLGKTRLIVDRFHYKSHKCCAYFNPDSYRQYDNERTETAESINARIEKGLKTIRYMKGEKLMPFLRVRFSLLNICACFKQQFTRTDIEDEDMTVFFNAMLPCSCGLCDELEMDKIVATEEKGNESEEDSERKETRGVGRGTNEDEGENGERDEDEDEDEQEDEKEDEKEDE